jgi:hypothetical protein
VYQILVVRCHLATCGHLLVLYKSFDYLNQLDGIGTTLRNFKIPRKLACGDCGPLLSFISLCVS